jgi:hypothetical protein
MGVFMSVSPVTAFNDLDRALVRGVALLTFAHSHPEDASAVGPGMESVMIEIFDAYSHLLSGSDAINEIKAFLLATHGGQPG